MQRPALLYYISRQQQQQQMTGLSRKERKRRRRNDFFVFLFLPERKYNRDRWALADCWPCNKKERKKKADEIRSPHHSAESASSTHITRQHIYSV